jgi:hypothetical protein
VAERERADLQAAAALEAQTTAQADRDRADQEAETALEAEAAAQAERDRAEQTAAEAFSRELAVQSGANLAVDPERSILLALAAVDAVPLPEAFSALQAATQASRLVWTANPQADDLLDVVATPDGRRLVTGGADGRVRVWDAANGKLLEEWPGHTGIIWVLALTRDGRRLATGSADGSVRVWDMTTGQVVHAMTPGGDITSVAFSPDGSRLAVGKQRGPEIIIYDPAPSGRRLRRLPSGPKWPSIVPTARAWPSPSTRRRVSSRARLKSGIP